MDALSQPAASGDFTLSLKRGEKESGLGKVQGLPRALSQGSFHGQRRAEPKVRVRSQSVVRIRVQPMIGSDPVSDQALLFRLLVEAAPLLAGISGGVLHVLLDPLCYFHAFPYCPPPRRLQAPDSTTLIRPWPHHLPSRRTLLPSPDDVSAGCLVFFL